jgi:hypothetical protein
LPPVDHKRLATMKKFQLHSSAEARQSLRRLVSRQAIDFGSRLLDRGRNGLIPFQEFVAVAAEVVHDRPEETAIYLAALVALDIDADGDDDDDAACAPRVPSAN